MEKLKIKHDHKLTDILKVGIFCLFLILPILLFLPNCLYYGFNEHATNTETTTINYKYQSNEVNIIDDLVVGNIYHFKIDNNSLDNIFNMGADSYFYATFININTYDFANYTLALDDYLRTSYENNGIITINFNVDGYYDGYLSVYLVNNDSNDYFTQLYIGELTDSFTLEGDFIFNDIRIVNLTSNPFSITDYNVIESVEVNTDNTITTQIGNSWASLWETPFLQWTDNNNFQFTINSFCNVFGITQESYITNYLTYILTMTCIYLVFDIVISISTKLTHMLTNSK